MSFSVNVQYLSQGRKKNSSVFIPVDISDHIHEVWDSNNLRLGINSIDFSSFISFSSLLYKLCGLMPGLGESYSYASHKQGPDPLTKHCLEEFQKLNTPVGYYLPPLGGSELLCSVRRHFNIKSTCLSPTGEEHVSLGEDARQQQCTISRDRYLRSDAFLDFPLLRRDRTEEAASPWVDGIYIRPPSKLSGDTYYSFMKSVSDHIYCNRLSSNIHLYQFTAATCSGGAYYSTCSIFFDGEVLRVFRNPLLSLYKSNSRPISEQKEFAIHLSDPDFFEKSILTIIKFSCEYLLVTQLKHERMWRRYQKNNKAILTGP